MEQKQNLFFNEKEQFKGVVHNREERNESEFQVGQIFFLTSTPPSGMSAIPLEGEQSPTMPSEWVTGNVSNGDIILHKGGEGKEGEREDGEIERKRETHAQRETQNKRQRPRDIHAQRHTEIETERDAQRGKDMLRDIPRNKDMWREKHTERRREIYRDKYRETNNAETQIGDTQI